MGGWRTFPPSRPLARCFPGEARSGSALSHEGARVRVMESLLWHLTNRTAETLLILSVFHLLLAALMLMVLLHQRLNRGVTGRPDRLVAIGIGLLMVNFAVLAGRFGLTFFFREQVNSPAVDRAAHALLRLALLCIASGYLDSAGGRRFRTMLPVFPLI